MEHGDFSTETRHYLQEAIRAAGGQEVFFRGTVDASRRVVGAEVLARGNEVSVPAVLQLCRYGEVVIHNHPSGDLRPSPADIEIASRLGSQGIGFQIVDNPVENVYRVVEAFPPRQQVPVEAVEIGSLLGPSGPIARNLSGYEERPEQLRMAFAVAEAFNHDRLALIEAGTGTGKSLAYLLPALLWALANEARVVVSTRTINLQEQLIRKDLPFLARASGLAFRAELVKGRGNYLCRRRLEGAEQEPGLFEDEAGGELAAIRAWAEGSSDGSREDLSFRPQENVWEEIRSEIDLCLRARCRYFGRCFFHGARRRAAQADLLVVNHSLLLSDLALRSQTDNYTAAAVLPPFERIILDEAHHLEEVATEHFSTRVSRFSFARTLGRLQRPRKPAQGLLPRLATILLGQLEEGHQDLGGELHRRIEELLIARRTLAERAPDLLRAVGEDLLGLTPGLADETAETRRRVSPDLVRSEGWGTVANRVGEIARETEALATGLRELLKHCKKLPESLQDRLLGRLADLASVATRLEILALELLGFTTGDPRLCTWFEIGSTRSGPVTRLCTAPLEVAASLRRSLFDRFRTVILTSATLTVAGRFDYFRGRTGLGEAPADRLLELLLPSPFDFSRQALVAIPGDLPEPGRPGFAEAICPLIERAVLAAGGRTFILFTSYALLRRVHGEVAPVLEVRGFRCLRQGESGRHRLLKRFVADPGSILFGTDSFWEGVDVPGRSLEQVILTRLPFKVPTDPVQQARAEAIEVGGGDAFFDYTVPQAVIKFKQGFGRLIRHRGDRGVVMVLDSRVVRKGYGRLFLRSLPDAPVAALSSEETLAAIENFFSAGP